MKRRGFIAGLAGVAAWPLAALAQTGGTTSQLSSTPLVGFLNSASAATYRFNADSFREGLKQAGFIEGQNVRIEERWANGDYQALPALAATPVYTGVVGPGFTITLAKKPTKAGKIKLVIRDKSNVHNFHLTGPGVNVKTSVSAIGTKTFTVTLKKGTYKFICDPHPFMKGSFTVR